MRPEEEIKINLSEYGFFAVIKINVWCKSIFLPTSINYLTVMRTIFSEFLIFCQLLIFRNNEGNIGHIVRGKPAITSLSLTCKLRNYVDIDTNKSHLIY